jgi:hypothetical protein
VAVYWRWRQRHLYGDVAYLIRFTISSTAMVTPRWTQEPRDLLGPKTTNLLVNTLIISVGHLPLPWNPAFYRQRRMVNLSGIQEKRAPCRNK